MYTVPQSLRFRPLGRQVAKLPSIWTLMVAPVAGLLNNPAATMAQQDATPPAQRQQLDNWQRDFDGILRLHDPSTMVKQGDRYWIVHTGTGIGSIYSHDLKQWHRGPSLLKELPPWVQDVVPGHRGHFWAPDLIKVGDRFLVYYSVSSFGKNESAIGLISSPTLDPESKDYQWTDHGIVVQTNSNSDHNAIDPSVCLTAEGELWMAYGSFWSGLKLVQLDPKTGLLLDKNQAPRSLAYQEQIEAPGLYQHGDYFYLFINWGWCCRGTNSTYNIRVGRSRNVEGPYLDQDGNDLRTSGGTLLLESEGNQIGPGHAGLFKTDQGWIMTYHYYDKDHGGKSRLGILPLRFNEEGWPVLEANRTQEENPREEELRK